ncbi:MAG: Yip1 family protein [Euryarchaeota archaeon]|nr:Yip1 family protein [Euryarchaeota archaeon]
MAPFLIVLIGAVIPAIAKMICYSSITVTASIAVELIAPFVAWFLNAGAFYAISIFLGGIGSFKRVFEFTGYGFILQILSAIFNAILLYALLSTHGSPPQFMVYVIDISGLLLLLWSVAIWVFAVKHARNLSTQDALFTIVGSVVVGGLLLLFTAFTFSPLL